MSFDKISVDMENAVTEVTNFNSGGYAQYITGITDAKIDLSGPYDQGNTSLTLGGSVTVTVGYSASVTLTVPGIIKSIKPDISVKDAERISVSVQSSGSFTASVS